MVELTKKEGCGLGLVVSGNFYSFNYTTNFHSLHSQEAYQLCLSAVNGENIKTSSIWVTVGCLWAELIREINVVQDMEMWIGSLVNMIKVGGSPV